MSGQMAVFPGQGREWSGYLSVGPQGGPGVILIQEWWGLVGHIKDAADRLAAEGFTVLAPDFYSGQSTEEPDEAGSLMMALNLDEAAQLILSSVEFLQGHASADGKGVGVIGFCMGGQLALFAACLSSDIKACVNFYGIHPKVQPDLASLEAPLLGLFAEHDDYASPATVAELSAKLTELGKAHDFKTYAGVHHAFFNDQRPSVYNEEAAADAWSRVLSHLRANLG